MTTELKPYIDKLIESVNKQINDCLSNKTDDALIEEHFTNRILYENNTRNHFRNFQEYYFRTINNTEAFLSPENFFIEFRKRYSILGITKDGLDKLEQNKHLILNLIQQDNLSELFFQHFKTENAHYGSLFTKIVHTFNPENYCAVDIPIRVFFGLQHESYFVCLIVISSAFKIWANDHKQRMDDLRIALENADKNNLLQSCRVTDIKLLNIIFWSLANPARKKIKN